MIVQEADGPETIEAIGDVLPKLFRDVSVTVSNLNKVRYTSETLGELTTSLKEAIPEQHYQSQIDPDLEIEEKLERAEESTKEALELFRQKREAGLACDELQGDREEMVIEAYKQAMQSLSSLHDDLVDLRTAMIEHDANLEEAEGPICRSASELLSSNKG